MTGIQKIFKRITQQGIVEEYFLWSGGGTFSYSRKLKLQFVSGQQKAADFMKILNDLPHTQEGCRLCEECIFQQDNMAIHNASIMKKYLLELEQKTKLLDHLACSPDLNPIENLWGLIVAKVYEGGGQYSAISELKNIILDAWEKYIRFNFRNLLIVCLAKILRLSKLMADLQNIKIKHEC